MTSLEAEFRELARIYGETAESLLASAPDRETPNPDAWAESILRQRACLQNIERMSIKVERLCDSWEKSDSPIEPESGRKIRSAMAEARAEALKLKQVFEDHHKRLEEARERLRSDLGIMAKQSQHLKSIQPVQNNYPKFIDSLY